MISCDAEFVNCNAAPRKAGGVDPRFLRCEGELTVDGVDPWEVWEEDATLVPFAHDNAIFFRVELIDAANGRTWGENVY